MEPEEAKRRARVAHERRFGKTAGPIEVKRCTRAHHAHLPNKVEGVSAYPGYWLRTVDRANGSIADWGVEDLFIWRIAEAPPTL